jgi:sialic acid synthase SpsE
MKQIKIGKKIIGDGQPAYIIAEVGSNFDGSKDRAKLLIELAKECGADAVKFQCFRADKIVSAEGFEGLKCGFQANWDKSVYEVYQAAEFPREWHEELFEYAQKAGIDFLSSPYDREAVDILDGLGVAVFKIGSGDITWPEMLRYIAGKGKPVILGTGASNMEEIDKAVLTIREEGNEEIVLLQCVTNYPSSFESANIRAMVTMAQEYDVLVGYSDHTPGSIVALGAVALGACVIEKHFTDDKRRKGPDHPFAMDAKDMKEMVDSIRTLEKALGDGVKELYEEENQTVVLQRRCLRAREDIAKGVVITENMIDVLRPAPKDGLYPEYKNMVVGRTSKTVIKKGSPFTWENV